MPASRPDPGALDVALAAGLAAAAGAVDVLAFTRLGHVFASVVTGNVVVVGVAIGAASWPPIARAGTAFVLYALGVVAGALLTRRDPRPSGRWPVRATVVCVVELLVLVGLAAVWLASGGSPRPAWQYVGLALAAFAMGLQSAAFRLVAVPAVSTTYFTGTLTALLAGAVAEGRLQGGALVALGAHALGATGSGVLVAHAATYAVLLPLGLLAAVVAVAAAARRNPVAGERGAG